MKRKIIDRYLYYFLFCLTILSCGKSDKEEYVDDKSPNHRDEKVKDNNTNQNKDNSDNKTDKNSNKKSFRDEKPVAVITPLEAADYTGKTVTVKGFVADIYKSEKVAYLNFVEKYPDNPFTAVIFANKFSDF